MAIPYGDANTAEMLHCCHISVVSNDFCHRNFPEIHGIATPVCGLVRNDVFFLAALNYNLPLQVELSPWAYTTLRFLEKCVYNSDILCYHVCGGDWGFGGF